jgi:hypothetical protein
LGKEKAVAVILEEEKEKDIKSTPHVRGPLLKRLSELYIPLIKSDLFIIH